MYIILKIIYTNNMILFVYCIEIFMARTIEMCISSIRTILLVKGKSIFASILSFIEIIIWFLIIKKTLLGDINIPILFSYALGYSLGTYIGVHINNKYLGGFNGIIIFNNTISKLSNSLIIDTVSLNKDYLLIICKKKHTKIIIDLINNENNQSPIIITEISNIIKNNHT